jgi:hypothetical protein
MQAPFFAKAWIYRVNKRLPRHPVLHGQRAPRPPCLKFHFLNPSDQ